VQFSVRRGSSGWASSARFTWRALVLAALAGVAVLLFAGTASAETCKTGCEDESDPASRNLLGSSVNTVNGLVKQPVRQVLGQGHGAAAMTSSDISTPAPAKETAPAAAPETAPAAASEDTTPELAQHPTNAVSTATTLAASTPSLDVAEPVVSTATDTVEAVVPVADAVATDLPKGQPLQDAVDTTTDAIAELGAAAVPVVAATTQTLDASTQRLLDTAQASTTAVLDSAQQVVATATSTLQPVTDSVTGALAITLGVAAPAGPAPSAMQAEPGSGAKQLGAATLGDTLPIIGIAFPELWTDLVARLASADGQVPTPPPEQTSDETSAADGDESVLVLTGQHAVPVLATSGAGAANGGTTSPSAPELGKVFFDLFPAAPQPGFVPALHHSAHVLSAPVVEPAQSPD